MIEEVSPQVVDGSHDSIRPIQKEKSNEISTKNVLLGFPNKKTKNFTFYIPCYFRMELKNFRSLSLPDLISKIHAKLMFDIQVTDLPPKMKSYLREKIILRLNDDPAFLLSSKQDPEISVKSRTFGSKKKKDSSEKRETIGFRIRKEVTAKIVPEIFKTPYELLYLVISLSIAHIQINKEDNEDLLKQIIEFISKFTSQKGQQQKIDIRFNIMDFNYPQYQYRKKQNDYDQRMMSRVLFTHDTSFGNYDLAERLINVQYNSKSSSRKVKELESRNNENSLKCCYQCCLKPKSTDKQEQQKQVLLKKNKKRNEDKIQQVSHAHFQFPIYRKPAVALLSIFAPLWLLGLISLGVFFQDNNLADRIASIATVMLAHVAFMPVIRAELPPTPRITFVEILIYLQILITFFCLVESVRILSITEDFDWRTNVLFLVSLSIQVFELVVIVSSVTVYYLCWNPSYNVKKGLQIYLDIQDWSHPERDDHYNDIMINYGYDVKEFNKIIKGHM